MTSFDLPQVAIAAPRKSSSCSDDSSDSDEKAARHVSGSDRLLIQRVKGGLGRTKLVKPVIDDSSSEESTEKGGCGCSRGGSRGGKGNNNWAESSEESRPSKWGSADESNEHDDDCTQVSKPQVVRTGGRCQESEKIYLHRQAPIFVRPPPSKIFINHPAVVVRQPPVILHHQSRSPVLVKPILIKEREVAARPVLFKISKPDNKVQVSKCENPTVHVSGGCGCERQRKPEKSCGCKQEKCGC